MMSITCSVQVVQHHFAHTGEICQAVDRAEDALALPLYDLFHAGTVPILGSAQRQALRLDARGVLAWNSYRGRRRRGYEITKLGKIWVAPGPIFSLGESDIDLPIMYVLNVLLLPNQHTYHASSNYR